jgi:hypothetical protein
LINPCSLAFVSPILHPSIHYSTPLFEWKIRFAAATDLWSVTDAL